MRTQIQDNTFAAACVDQNTLAELEAANRQQYADAGDCQTWNLSPDQWREQIALALAAKREQADRAD